MNKRGTCPLGTRRRKTGAKTGKGRRLPVGPYPSSRVGRCACVFADDGLLLRVLPNAEAAARWTAKHFGQDAGGTSCLRCRSKAQVNGVFDDQMKKGLTSEREIADLLWYGGIASDMTAAESGRRTRLAGHYNNGVKEKSR